ncbi:hypothetical protein WA158_007888 [Blastocystis sp. Blastoise]
MSEVLAEQTQEKYLFTFQDEKQLWISKEFIEKYPQFPFQDIIQHSEKYEDGSFFVDMPSFSMDKVIQFLRDDNMDIDSLDLDDSADIYQALVEYSIDMRDERINDLLFHIEELFYNYLSKNKYYSLGKCDLSTNHTVLFNSQNKVIRIYGLMTPQQKDELLRYSFLFKMMNIAYVEIRYQYAPNIPSEYIYPSCIQDIFPLVKTLSIFVVAENYLKGDILLNPNSDEYIHEYISFCKNNGKSIGYYEKFDYYTESEMDEYNKNNSFDIENTNVDWHIKNSYSDRKYENKLPKLYEAVLDVAVYSDDYTQVKTSPNIYYSIQDNVVIKYGDKTELSVFSRSSTINTEKGLSQLLRIPSSFQFSKLTIDTSKISESDIQFAIIFMKAFEEGYFDSLTSLNLSWIMKFNELIDNDEFIKMILTHKFPNVTELNFDRYDDSESFTLSTINKEHFPNLHILTYEDSEVILSQPIPEQYLSAIDILNVENVVYSQREEMAIYLDDLAYNHSIHLFLGSTCIDLFPHIKEILDKGLLTYTGSLINLYKNKNYNPIFDNILEDFEKRNEKVDYFKMNLVNYKIYDDYQEYNSYYYYYKNDDEVDNNNNDDNNKNDENVDNKNDETPKFIDVKDAFKKLFNSSFFQNLQNCNLNFDKRICINELKRIDTIFNDKTFNSINYLNIQLPAINMDVKPEPEYFSIFKNILIKIVSKASNITFNGYGHDDTIMQLIQNRGFQNATKINLEMNNIPIKTFFESYTKTNFPKLQTFTIFIKSSECVNDFQDNVSLYNSNDNLPLASTLYLNEQAGSYRHITFNSNQFIPQIEGNIDLSVETIIIKKDDDSIAEHEIEKFIDYIKQQKIPNLRTLDIDFNNDILLFNVIDFILSGEIPKLKKFTCRYDINKLQASEEAINEYKQKMKDSTFIKKNHVFYEFILHKAYIDDDDFF